MRKLSPEQLKELRKPTAALHKRVKRALHLLVTATKSFNFHSAEQSVEL
jgi:hypothetical protein